MTDSGSDLDSLPPLDESKNDEHETRMAYQSGTHLPLFVAAVWASAFIGLAIYFFLHYVGDLRKWGAP